MPATPRIACLALLLSSLCIAGGAALAEQKLKWPSASFSGRLEIRNGEPRGKQQLSMTVYSAGRYLRLDFTQKGRPISIILDRKERRMIALSHERKQAVILPYRERSDIARLFNRSRGRLTREGVESVNGVRAVRYKFEGRNADGDTFSGHVWMTRQRIVVRLQEADKRPGKARPFVLNLRDLKVGKLPAGTFRAPKGYAVIDATDKKAGKGGR